MKGIAAWLLVGTIVGCGASHDRPDGGPEADSGTSRLDSAIRRDVGVAVDAGFDGGTDGGGTSLSDAGDAGRCATVGGSRCVCEGIGCTPGSESFEREDYDSLELGTYLPIGYVFWSGLQASARIRHGADFSLVLTACDRPTGFYGLTCPDDASLVPDGTAFLGVPQYSGAPGSVTMALPASASRVRFRLASVRSANNPVQVEGVDSSGAVITSDVVTPARPSDWADGLVTVEGSDLAAVRLSTDPVGPLMIDWVQWE